MVIVSASVGAGHDGAAAELRTRLEARGASVETHDFLDALPRWMAFGVREGYTGTVTHTPWFYDWLYDSMERPGWVHGIGMGVCRLATPTVRRWSRDADVVVSTYPLASQSLGQLARRGALAVPTATFLTDPSVHALWVNPYVDRHLTTLGVTASIGESVYGISMSVAGPLVPDRFSQPVNAARRAELLASLGVPVGRPVALVVTGSLGLGDVQETVRAILATGVATPLVLCGRNERLRRDLRALGDVLAVGWRRDMPDLMQVCDVLVHNAGGLSFSESLVAGLPAVTYACIPGHGKANGQALAQSGVAPLATDVASLRRALQEQLAPVARERVRSAVAVAERDASAHVLHRLPELTATVRAAASGIRRRRLVRRRLSAAVATVLVALTSVGATEGVSVAAQRGFGVSKMPSGTVAVVVQPASLSGLHGTERALARRDAAVIAPRTLTAADVVEAGRLVGAGVAVLRSPCTATSLLHDSRQCGSTSGLLAAGVPVAPLEVHGAEVEALDIVVARRDRSRIVIGRDVTAGTPSPPGPSTRDRYGTVWMVRPTSRQSLPAQLAHLGDAAHRYGLALRPVTDARRRS